MSEKWKALREAGKYWKHLLLIVLLLASVKPAVLTWYLIRAGAYFRVQPKAAEGHMFSAILHRPAAYHAFKKYNLATADRLLLKSLVKTREFHRLEEANLSPQGLARLKQQAKNNLYLLYLFPRFINEVRQPENLDTLSLELLANPAANPLSRQVFDLHLTSLSRGFKENMADYCQWQGNPAMAEYWNKAVDAPIRPGTAGPPDLERLLLTSGFGSDKEIRTAWRFANMANVKPFGDGSFTMGRDRIGDGHVLRLMGFFTDNRTARTPARAGAWYAKPIPVTGRIYRFSFYYATRTGHEKPSFFLANNLPEQFLPHTKGQWIKVEFYIRNQDNRFKQLRPLVRMWGTGSMWVDDVELTELTGPPAKEFLEHPLRLEPAGGEKE
jgi:hypothetical protein